MIRILHLGKFYPPDNGGIESVTASLARGAVQAGYAVTVHCFEEHAKGDQIDLGVHVSRVPLGIKIASQPLGFRYLWRGWRLVRKTDLVHIHVPNMLGALLVLFVPARVKVIVHWHSDVVGKGIMGRLFAPLEASMLRRANCIMCTSQAYADASKTVQPFIKKVVVIPLGVPDHRAQHLAGEGVYGKSGLPVNLSTHIAGRPVVLSVGRLVAYKGYSVLIDAVKLMQTDAAIVIVGGGPLGVALQKQINEKNLHSRVVLAGRLDAGALSALQSMATLFCMPSNERSEAFGVALLEAMVWGLPLVATKIDGSGVPWVNLHGQSGLNVPSNDPHALAEALDKLLLNKKMCAELASGSRSRYENLFTENQAIAKTINLYSNIYKC
jgi:glycosyltransferase involved in cell wall biosynthesis